MISEIELTKRLGFPEDWLLRMPLAIAHRGASGYALENTESAFRKASELDADLWELDIQLSADRVCVVSHNDDLREVSDGPGKISQSTWSELAGITLHNGEHLLTLEQVIELAVELDRGLYVEIKAQDAAEPVWRALEKQGFKRAIIGSFQPAVVRELRDSGCDYPLSILVENGVDPFLAAEQSGADIVHLCWRDAGQQPHKLITNELLLKARQRGLLVVLWHEERREVLDALAQHSFLAICSDRPETLKPYQPDKQRPIRIVCHRGANQFTPENTLEAARMCFDQKFDFVELDVRTTSDGALVVIHDATVDRTTSGSGSVADMTLAELRSLDAGSWFDPHFAAQRIPTLRDMLKLAAQCGGGLYVEPKTADPERVLSMIVAADMLGRCFFGSEDPQAMRDLRRLSSDATLMARRCDFPSLQAAVDDCDSQIIEFDATQDDLGEIERFGHLHVQSMIYDQTHDIGVLERLHAIGPDYVNLDRPDLFKRVVRDKSQLSRSALPENE